VGLLEFEQFSQCLIHFTFMICASPFSN
jgi:hypothetical protein